MTNVDPPRQKNSQILVGIRAIIFDMDELMVNSHPVHMKTFEQMLRSHGVSMEKDPLTVPEEAGLFGRTIPDILSFLHKRYKLPPNITVEKMNATFKELLLPTFAKHVEPMTGVEEIIHVCKDKGYTLALASSSSRAKIDTVLKKLHLTDVFDKFTLERLGIRQDLGAADLQVNSLTEAQNYFFPPSKG